MKSPSPDITRDPRWTSIVTRDKAADGSFWYSVATTGVFCRPSCPSRLANPKNVRLHESPGAAEAAGFRACRRCNPDGISIDAANAAIVTKACRLIDEAAEPLSLTQLAESVELSPHYFHRLFKKATGLTPKAYAAAARSARLAPGAGSGGDGHRGVSRGGLRLERAVLRGFGRRAGHEPDPLPVRRCPGGADLRRRPMLARRHPRRVERQGRRRDPAGGRSRGLAARSAGPVSEGPTGGRRRGLRATGGPGGRNASKRRRTASTLPLDVRGTAFQQRVWQALRDIPAGATETYSSIAREDRRRPFRAGRRRSVRGQRSTPWRSRATASCGRTATSRAIAGAWSASAS